MYRSFLSTLLAAVLILGQSVAFPSQVLAQAAPPAQTCQIVPTDAPWNPQGTMAVSVDATSVGSFQYGPAGSAGLSFACSASAHTFGFSTSLHGQPATCTGSFDATNQTNFSPQLSVSLSGTVGCALLPQEAASNQTSGPSQTCQILATDAPWNPQGTMAVSVDGTGVGAFVYGSAGSDSLSFACTAAKHAFAFSTSLNGQPASCTGTFDATNETSFVPQMRVSFTGVASCRLRPQTPAANATSAPSQTAALSQAAAPGQTCQIAATTSPWNPPGTMEVTVDGAS
ncbi:MAG TPA: hypothetical protein VGD50_02005, partial [Candidatus Baltobacteraceae bacterium]